MKKPHATPTTLEVGELLYEAVVRLSSITAYGANLDAIVAGTERPPPEGARFDLAFGGEFTGPRLAGTLTGVDYINVRADGRFELDLRAHLQTRDGHSVALSGGGTAFPGLQPGTYELREHLCYRTAAPTHAWLNQVQAWARGTVDVAAGELCLRVYVA
jgi:hypothetical protein